MIVLAALLALFVVLPLGAVLVGAGPPGAVAGHLDALGNSLLLAAGTATLASAIGAPLGVLLARYRLPGWVQAGCVLPYAIPPYVTTIAWMTLANPTNGWLPLPLDVYTLTGMIWVLGLHLAPVVMLGVRDAVGRLDPALEEAARIAGASPRRVWIDVTLPMLAPAVLTGAGFVASAALASFGVPYLLSAAASSPAPVLTTRIYQALDLGFVAGRPLAATLAIVLLAIGVGVPLLLRLLTRGRSYAGARPVPRVQEAPPTLAWVGALGFLGVAVVLPAGTVLLTSVLASLGGGWTPSNLTLATWSRLVGDDRVLDAFARSAWLAAITATVAVGMGVLLGHAAERGRRFGGALAALARLGYSIPGTVLALGLVLAWSQEVRVILLERVTLVLALADTAWILGIAYVARFLALPVDGVRASLRTLHPSLEEAARLSGAGPWRVLRDVTVPLLLPALGTAWFLVFVPSLCEVTLSVLLRGPRTEVLGTLLFYLQSYADAQSASALAVLVTAVLLVGMGLSRGLRRAW